MYLMQCFLKYNNNFRQDRYNIIQQKYHKNQKYFIKNIIKTKNISQKESNIIRTLFLYIISMLFSSSSSLSSLNSQKIFQKLFITTDPKKFILNLNLLKQISLQQHYRSAIDLILILQKVLLTNNKKLSLRELIINSTKQFTKGNNCNSNIKTVSTNKSFTFNNNNNNISNNSFSKFIINNNNNLDINNNDKFSKTADSAFNRNNYGQFQQINTNNNNDNTHNDNTNNNNNNDNNDKIILKKQRSINQQKSFQMRKTSLQSLQSPNKNIQTTTNQKQNQEKQQQQQLQQQKQQFMSSQLRQEQKVMITSCLLKLKPNFQYTIYESKINFILQLIKSFDKQSPSLLKLTTMSKSLQQNKSQLLLQQQLFKRLLKQLQLDNNNSKMNKIQQFISKTYVNIDGKFTSSIMLYKFICSQILPLIQRHIMSIPLINHNQKQSFIFKAISFIQSSIIHQFVLEIKINKATLIENRIFVEKIWKEKLKIMQTIIMNKTFMNIINQGLLCPSNLQIQLVLFRILKRMYYLWGNINNNEYNTYNRTNQLSRLSQLIKYPLFLNIKNISLYSSPSSQQQHLKQPSMFSYKIITQKSDLQLSSLIQTNDQLRFIRESKYFSSKAYLFSQQCNKIYDTFDLKLNNFWHYNKKIPKGETFTYNLIVQKPNSLLIWQFYLVGFDIKFGIYKVQTFKKHTIDQYSKQLQCKQILKFDKYNATSNQTEKGFIFLKNGMYKLIFDNTYSNFRAKQLNYLIMHLQSEN